MHRPGKLSVSVSWLRRAAWCGGERWKCRRGQGSEWVRHEWLTGVGQRNACGVIAALHASHHVDGAVRRGHLHVRRAARTERSLVAGSVGVHLDVAADYHVAVASELGCLAGRRIERHHRVVGRRADLIGSRAKGAGSLVEDPEDAAKDAWPRARYRHLDISRLTGERRLCSGRNLHRDDGTVWSSSAIARVRRTGAIAVLVRHAHRLIPCGRDIRWDVACTRESRGICRVLLRPSIQEHLPRVEGERSKPEQHHDGDGEQWKCLASFVGVVND